MMNHRDYVQLVPRQRRKKRAREREETGYNLSFPDPTNHEQIEPLLQDAPPENTMFRIVVKSNLTMSLAEDLADQIKQVILIMDEMESGYSLGAGAGSHHTRTPTLHTVGEGRALLDKQDSTEMFLGSLTPARKGATMPRQSFARLECSLMNRASIWSHHSSGGAADLRESHFAAC
jgi:hypothetical protein